MILPSVSSFLNRQQKLLINGEWKAPHSGQYVSSINPATGEVLTQIASGNKEDVDLAVQAAQQALEQGDWAKMSPADRGKLLWHIADLVDEQGWLKI